MGLQFPRLSMGKNHDKLSSGHGGDLMNSSSCTCATQRAEAQFLPAGIPKRGGPFPTWTVQLSVKLPP